MQSSLDLFLTVMETFESKRGVWDAYGGGGGGGSKGQLDFGPLIQS